MAALRCNRFSTRSVNSAAAFSVKVMARISSGLACPCSMSHAIRSTRTVVFPVPAPASTSIGPWTCSIASCCFGLGENLPAMMPAQALCEKKAKWAMSFSHRLFYIAKRGSAMATSRTRQAVRFGFFVMHGRFFQPVSDRLSFAFRHCWRRLPEHGHEPEDFQRLIRVTDIVQFVFADGAIGVDDQFSLVVEQDHERNVVARPSEPAEQFVGARCIELGISAVLFSYAQPGDNEILFDHRAVRRHVEKCVEPLARCAPRRTEDQKDAFVVVLGLLLRCGQYRFGHSQLAVSLAAKACQHKENEGQ